MDPITLALIGAGIGAAKSEFIDRPQEKKDRALQATTARYSPWTGLAPQKVQNANLLGSVMQGGMAGATMGQSLAASEGVKAASGGMGAGGGGQMNLGVQYPQNYVAPEANVLGGGNPYQDLYSQQPQGPTWNYMQRRGN